MNKIYGTLIDRTMKIIRQNYNDEFKRNNIDLTTDQWVILDSIYQKDGQSQTELAESNFKNFATLSRIIDLTCNKGITKRVQSKEDKRKYNIFITKKGQTLYKQVMPLVEELRLQGWDGLDQSDYDIFKKTIDKVYWNFQNRKN